MAWWDAEDEEPSHVLNGMGAVPIGIEIAGAHSKPTEDRRLVNPEIYFSIVWLAK